MRSSVQACLSVFPPARARRTIVSSRISVWGPFWNALQPLRPWVLAAFGLDLIFGFTGVLPIFLRNGQARFSMQVHSEGTTRKNRRNFVAWRIERPPTISFGSACVKYCSPRRVYEKSCCIGCPVRDRWKRSFRVRLSELLGAKKRERPSQVKTALDFISSGHRLRPADANYDSCIGEGR